jgi:ABC-2 type transport system permease protein
MAVTFNEQTIKAQERTRKPGAGMWRGISTLWLKQMRKFFTSSMELGSTLFMPVLWMVIFGVCMGTTASNLALGYIAFITPGVILLTCSSAAVMGGSILLQEYLNGTLKEYLIAPVPRLSILLGTISSSLSKAMLQAFIILVMSLLLGAVLILNPLYLVLGLALVALFSLGFIGVAVIFACRARRMESYHSLIITLNLPLLFLSNALYPLDKVPEIVRILAYFNPVTYSVDALRFFFYGTPPEIGLGIDIAVLLGFVGVTLWLSYRYFQKLVGRMAG